MERDTVSADAALAAAKSTFMTAAESEYRTATESAAAELAAARSSLMDAAELAAAESPALAEARSLAEAISEPTAVKFIALQSPEVWKRIGKIGRPDRKFDDTQTYPVFINGQSDELSVWVHKKHPDLDPLEANNILLCCDDGGCAIRFVE